MINSDKNIELKKLLNNYETDYLFLDIKKILILFPNVENQMNDSLMIGILKLSLFDNQFVDVPGILSNLILQCWKYWVTIKHLVELLCILKSKQYIAPSIFSVLLAHSL